KAGSFSVTSTDVIVALLLLGWGARSVASRSMIIHAGPTIGALLLVFLSAFLSSLGAIEFPDALKELIKLTEMIGIALYASSTLRGPGVRRFVALALIAAGPLEALVGLGQFVTRSGPDAFELGPFLRAYGNFAQPNALAGFLGTILPFGVVFSLRSGRE